MDLPSHSRPWASLWLPPAAVLVVGAALSATLAWVQYRTVQTTAHERVAHSADAFVQGLEHRIDSFSEIAKGLQVRFALNPDLTRKEFEGVVLAMDVPRRYQGVRALTFTRVLAPGDLAGFEDRVRSDVELTQQIGEGFRIRFAPDRSEYAVVDYVWPLRGNAALVGLDVSLQPESLASLLQARSTGGVTASAPFTLLQDATESTGVLIRAPIFGPGTLQTEPVFLGSVNVSLQTHELVDSILGAVQLDGVALAVHDVGRTQGGDQGLHNTIYVSPDWRADRKLPAVVRDFQFHDRTWRIQFMPRAALLSRVENSHPWLLGAGGLAASGLLALLVALLARQRFQARQEVANTQTALEESNDRFHALFHHSGMGVSKVCSQTGRFLQVNQRYCEILGYTEQELLRTNILDLTGAEDVGESRRLMEGLCTGRLSNYLQSKRMVRRDRSLVWVEVAASPLLGRHHELLGQHISVIQDVSERRNLQATLEQREARLGAMLQALPVGILIVDADQRILYVNHRFTALTGYGLQELHTLDDWWRAAQPDDAQRQTSRAWVESARREAFAQGVMPACELAVHCKDGKIRALELSGSPAQGDFVFTLVDLSQRKQAEEKIRNLAMFDMLTQLPNRRQLLERIVEALQQCTRQSTGGALLLLDIDNFKTLNETQGHDQGDTLLLQISQRLTQCMVQNGGIHTLARQGGDEFAVVLEGLSADRLQAAQQAERVGRRLMEALKAPFTLGEAPCHVTVSMGAATFYGMGESMEDVLKRADLAMFEAKNAGRNALHFFDPSMQAAIRARAEMESDLRTALEHNQFDLYYQPQVTAHAVTGCEALLRWCHPTKGFISPALFVPLAEENGMVLPLGQWVLHTACRQLAQWAQRPGLSQLTVSVNVSPRQFHEPGFVQEVEHAIATFGVRAERLKLELTEGLLLNDVEDTIRKMERLRAMGVGFSLDDFGTGYSSLSYLKRLPLEQLKIDQSFVREVLTNANDSAIARTIVALGSTLGLRVIAEGVETDAQRDFLDASGCHAWQGYLFSPAVPAAQFEAWVAQYKGVSHGVVA